MCLKIDGHLTISILDLVLVRTYVWFFGLIYFHQKKMYVLFLLGLMSTIFLVLAFVKSFVLPVCSKKLSASIILEPVCKSDSTVRSPWRTKKNWTEKENFNLVLPRQDSSDFYLVHSICQRDSNHRRVVYKTQRRYLNDQLWVLALLLHSFVIMDSHSTSPTFIDLFIYLFN